MKFIRLFCVVTAVLFSAVASVAQAPSGVFSCIEFSTSTACPLSGTPSLASLEGNTAQFAVGAIVSVSGYHAVADGGAGEYVMLGSPGGSPSVCNGYTNSGFTNVTGSAGSAALSITGEPYPAGLTVGEMVSGSGSSLQVQTGSEIASITFNNTGTKIIGISLTLPLTGMNTSPNVTITIAGNNTGTLILDSYGGGTGLSSNQCWQKINYRGDPHEFGAYGDGVTDDTTPMEDWFGAYGNVNPNLAPSTAPPNFGPWIAAIPANYMVTEPLICPPDATLQGYSALIAGSSFTHVTGNPAVRIFAGAGFTGGSALLTTGDYCRITGLAIDANNIIYSGTGIDAVDIGGTHNSIDGRSLIENGNHNVYCGGVQVDGLQLKDSQFIKSGADNIYMPNHCANVRLTGDLVQSSKGNGVLFGGDDLTISGGVIEESQGNGLDLEGAHEVAACETYYDIDGNMTAGAAAIRIANSATVTVCGNHFQRSGGDPAGSAHIVFSGTDSNMTFGANVYRTNSTPGDPAVRPWYVYDAEAGTVLTNTHFYESPRPQIAAVWSPNAVALGLPALQVPQTVHNSYAGLTLSNEPSPTPSQTVDIAAGAAADSTSAAVIQNPGCTVNLADNGLGGLDQGSVAANTTYFFFVVATGDGAMPNCMASTSQTPTFRIDHFDGTPYMLDVTGWTQAGNAEVYNVGTPFAGLPGVVPGIAVDATGSSDPIQPSTTVTALETSNVSATGTWTGGTDTITVDSSSGFIRGGMIILDTMGCIPSGTIVLSTSISPTITISNDTKSGCSGSGSNLQLSSGQQVSLSQPATQTGIAHLKFSTALFRLAGALYTDGSGNVIPFTQDGNAFYLARSVTDVQTGTMLLLCGGAGGLAPQSCPLSVPCGRTAATCAAPGLKVIAFGRIVGGSGDILLSSLDQAVQPPNNFPATPGYTVNSATANTAHPFHLYTDGNGNVRVQANSASNTVSEVTDGWTLDLAGAGMSLSTESGAGRRVPAIPKRGKTRH